MLVGERRTRAEAAPRGTVERVRETMQASVTIRGAGIPSTANPRFPGPGSSSQGKPGPKARPKGVADGQQANIPAPGRGARRMTPETGPAAVQEATAAQAGAPFNKARRGPATGREKSAERRCVRPVPQTDTGGWVEQTKVRKRNHVKELGKLVP